MSDASEQRRDLKDRILEAALQHAAFDGWGERTLELAAADAGVDRATARRLFPQGGESLLEWLEDWADRRMLARVAGEDLTRLPVRRRIARLVRARFEALAPYRESLRRAAVARTLPQHLPGGLQALWRTVDRIWRTAGFERTAEGMSYYSRRLLLAAILVATFFYWLEDSSEDFRDTWAFLDRRIEDALTLGRLPERLADFVPFGARRGTRPAG